VVPTEAYCGGEAFGRKRIASSCYGKAVGHLTRINPLDSRGLIYLKLGDYDQAIASYDETLKLDPKYADSLYGRGIAKLRKGDTSDGNADIAPAKAIKPDVAEDFAGYGVK